MDRNTGHVQKKRPRYEKRTFSPVLRMKQQHFSWSSNLITLADERNGCRWTESQRDIPRLTEVRLF